MAKNKQNPSFTPPVSRKTNEEIDTDEQGNLIIDGDVISAHQTNTNNQHTAADNAEHMED